RILCALIGKHALARETFKPRDLVVEANECADPRRHAKFLACANICERVSFGAVICLLTVIQIGDFVQQRVETRAPRSARSANLSSALAAGAHHTPSRCSQRSSGGPRCVR